jgi:hypothetical protein
MFKLDKKNTLIGFRILYICILSFFMGFVVHFNTDLPKEIGFFMIFGGLFIATVSMFYISFFSTLTQQEQNQMNWFDLLGIKPTPKKQK